MHRVSRNKVLKAICDVMHCAGMDICLINVFMIRDYLRTMSYLSGSVIVCHVKMKSSAWHGVYFLKRDI